MAVHYHNDFSSIGFIVIEQLGKHHQTKYNSYPRFLYISAFAYTNFLVSQMREFYKVKISNSLIAYIC